MHIATLILLAIVLILIYRSNEKFIASFDMMINRAQNPLYVQYHGRLRDANGLDYYDHYLKNQLQSEYSR